MVLCRKREQEKVLSTEGIWTEALWTEALLAILSKMGEGHCKVILD